MRRSFCLPCPLFCKISSSTSFHVSEALMPSVQAISAKRGDVLLMVGTMKGMFLLRSNAARKRWDVGGPYSVGSPVYAAGFDSRQGRNRLWWAQQSFRWGTIL